MMATDGPQPMRQILVDEPGGPERLRVADVPTPTPGQGQIRIAIHVAGVKDRKSVV